MPSWVDRLPSWVPTPKWPLWRIALLLAVTALVFIVVARVLGAQAKDAIATATAIAGLTTVVIGLSLALDAGKLLYDKESRSTDPGLGNQSARKSAIRSVATDLAAAQVDAQQEAAVRGVAASGLGVTPIDLNELLPKLITTAAGLAVALILLGGLMLVGSTVAAPEASASPSPSGSAVPGATGTPAPVESASPGTS